MLKTKRNILLLTCVLALPFLCAQAIATPHSHDRAQSEQAPNKDKTDNANVYRVTYKVSELQNGKTINSRSYTLMAKTGSKSMSRVGSRIPIKIGPQYQFQSVGMKIDCTVTEHEGNLLVQTDIDTTSVADNEPSTPTQFPVVRDLILRDVTSATIGKPALVGSIDDVYSNRHYLIEVTVTKAV